MVNSKCENRKVFSAEILLNLSETRTSELRGLFTIYDLPFTGFKLSGAPYRKPRSVFPSKRECRFGSLKAVHDQAAPGYRADQRRCRASGWQKNGAARAD